MISDKDSKVAIFILTVGRAWTMRVLLQRYPAGLTSARSQVKDPMQGGQPAGGRAPHTGMAPAPAGGLIFWYRLVQGASRSNFQNPLVRIRVQYTGRIYDILNMMNRYQDDGRTDHRWQKSIYLLRTEYLIYIQIPVIYY